MENREIAQVLTETADLMEIDGQDSFRIRSYRNAVNAIEKSFFKDDIVPVSVTENYLDENEKPKTRTYVVDTDEGPRADTSAEKLAQLKPVFDAKGTVTAGNSSQTSDGAAFVIVVMKLGANDRTRCRLRCRHPSSARAEAAEDG